MALNANAAFDEKAKAVVRTYVERLRQELTFEKAKAMPEAEGEDVVVELKEVQLTVFRQAKLPFLGDRILVTVQLARHGMGGVVLYKHEQGLMFSPGGSISDATAEELALSAQ
ncbi:MAG: hypothetical protein ABW136_05395 [Steroidobacteraceae bacterium]